MSRMHNLSYLHGIIESVCKVQLLVLNALNWRERDDRWVNILHMEEQNTESRSLLKARYAVKIRYSPNASPKRGKEKLFLPVLLFRNCLAALVIEAWMLAIWETLPSVANIISEGKLSSTQFTLESIFRFYEQPFFPENVHCMLIGEKCPFQGWAVLILH